MRTFEPGETQGGGLSRCSAVAQPLLKDPLNTGQRLLPKRLSALVTLSSGVLPRPSLES